MSLKCGVNFSRDLGDVYLEVMIETLGTEEIAMDTLQKDEKEQKKLREKSTQCLKHMHSTSFFSFTLNVRDRQNEK